MNIMLTSLAFAFAVLFAALMGYAIQRGGTCTVAAVEELLGKRQVSRLLGMGEAALWVAGGLLVANALHVLPQIPASYAISVWTVIGGALLGLGAYVNRACVFGAIARLGSGEWAYAATPVGFYVGCVSVAWFSAPAPLRVTDVSPVVQASGWLALVFLGFALWRLAGLAHAVVRPGDVSKASSLGQRLAATLWAPHVATTVIGIAFVFLLLLVGTWAYTDTLADLARGMAASIGAKILLLAGLFGGAILGGWTAGRLHSTRVSIAQLLRCFTGGVMMAWGSLLIPGSNDGMILIGIPLLRPYAWTGFVTMCAVIAAALLLERALGSAASQPATARR